MKHLPILCTIFFIIMAIREVTWWTIAGTAVCAAVSFCHAFFGGKADEK